MDRPLARIKLYRGMNLLLIEGIPGSGKTTLAKRLYDTAVSQGINASWHREEARDHPLHPHSGSRDDRSAEGFLNQWREFIASHAERDQLLILEGSLFQSSVRYLLEAGNPAEIPDYYSACQALLNPVSARLIYLRPSDITSHIHWLLDHRGEDWSRKLTNYLDRTPYCRKRGWCGCEGMIRFIGDYVEICDSLVKQTEMPYQSIGFDVGAFESHFEKAIEIFDFD